MIPRVSFTGILMYRFVISNVARANCGSIGVSTRFSLVLWSYVYWTVHHLDG